MTASESPRTMTGASSTGEVTTSIAQATDNRDRPAVDDQYEIELRSWAEGWDAAAAYYKPALERAEADADRFYRRAFDKPGDARRRVDAGLAGFERRFMAGEAR